jgi:hypothetical protein
VKDSLIDHALDCGYAWIILFKEVQWYKEVIVLRVDCVDHLH